MNKENYSLIFFILIGGLNLKAQLAIKNSSDKDTSVIVIRKTTMALFNLKPNEDLNLSSPREVEEIGFNISSPKLERRTSLSNIKKLLKENKIKSAKITIKDRNLNLELEKLKVDKKINEKDSIPN